jgi:hypothetical protein
MGSLGAQWYSRPEQADQQHGFADFYQRFFGETPSQKTPDTGLASIRVAKLGNAYTGQPPHKNRSSMLRSAYPPRGTPSISRKSSIWKCVVFFFPGVDVGRGSGTQENELQPDGACRILQLR